MTLLSFDLWRDISKIFLAVLMGMATLSFSAADAAEGEISLGCGTFDYAIDGSGRNLRFVDRSDGVDYLRSETGAKAYCAYIEKDGKTFVPKSAALADGILHVTFDDGVSSADIRITDETSRVIFSVEKAIGNPETLCFLNVPLTLNAHPDESFAVCALSLNLETHVYELPALHRNLWAASYSRFDLEKGKAAAIGVPQKEILPVIRAVLTEAAADVPLSDQGGAWALDAKEGYGSYFLQSAGLTEETVDEWITACREIGFDQIDNHGGSKSFFLFGSLELNKERYPEGWKSYKKVVDRLHDAGISSILHTYTCYISPDSEFVTPVPHPNLDLLSSFTLAEPIDAAATEITVKESTIDVSTAIGYMETSNRTFRIGDEIIQFADVTRTAPYKFTGCVRGFHGTGIAEHKAGDKVGILKTFWSGLYVPDPNSPLFDEIARRTAQVVNETGFDGVYFDAIEGLQYMWGKENYWYYGDKFIFEFMRHLKKPVGLEYAGMVHHWWNYRSRYQAWDVPSRGYKRFMDIHISSMKAGEEYQHGSWGGSWADIQKFGPMKDCGLHLPLQLGWWFFRTWDSPKNDAMFLDDIEYLCCKMLGNRAGFSMTRTDPAVVESHPIFQKFIDMMGRYQRLKKENYFSEEICARLREPGKEFTLESRGEEWTLRPILYDAHKIEMSAEETLRWTFDQPYAEQSPKIRIEALTAAGSDAPEKKADDADLPAVDSSATGTFVTLLDVPSLDGMTSAFAADGVTLTLTPSDEKVPATGEAALKLTAASDGTSEQTASFARLTKTFTAPLDLSRTTGLGVWVYGDGSGAVVDFSLASAGSGMGANQSSHYVILDFTGWRHFTFVEPESSRISDYRWPILTKYYVYDNHWGVADYGAVAELRIQVNNLPSDRPVNGLIGPIRAVPLAPGKVVRPTLTVNGQSVTFPVTMETGMFLEVEPNGMATLYAPSSVPLETIDMAGKIPTLVAGENTLDFSAETQENNDPPRARITLGVKGDPLR